MVWKGILKVLAMVSFFVSLFLSFGAAKNGGDFNFLIFLSGVITAVVYLVLAMVVVEIAEFVEKIYIRVMRLPEKSVNEKSSLLSSSNKGA